MEGEGHGKIRFQFDCANQDLVSVSERIRKYQADLDSAMAEIRQKIWNSRGYLKFDANGAKEYAMIANEVFAPIYPVIARKIIEHCGVNSGSCVDIGSGAANLAMALAEMTSLRIFALDFSEEIQKSAMENFEKRNLVERVVPVLGDVHHIQIGRAHV